MNILYRIFTIVKEVKVVFLLLFVFLLPGVLFASGNNPFLIELLAGKQPAGASTITVAISNQSSEALYLLKWNTPLEENLNANVFDVQFNNKKITYLGRMVKRGKPADKDFVLMQAGEVIYKTLTLHHYYKMEKKGTYKVAYKGRLKYLQNRLAKDEKKQGIKRAKVIPEIIELDFTPGDIEEQPSQKLPAGYNNCTASEITTISSAHDAAIELTRIASEAMNNEVVPTSAERYTEWFGAANTDRHNIVKTNLANILSALDTEVVTFNCNCDENWYAYVYPSLHYDIYICNGFWGAALTGTDSQAGTLIHETSHFTIVAETDDYVYGQSGARDLAISNPEQAVNNADSHEFFAENTPYLSMSVAQEDYGDTLADAHQLVLMNGSVSITSNIETGDDTDFFTFNVPASGEIQVYTTGSLDTIGHLYKQDGAELGTNDDADDYNFKIIKDISSGQHFVSVDSYGTDTGYYTLQINIISSFNTVPVINYLLD